MSNTWSEALADLVHRVGSCLHPHSAHRPPSRPLAWDTEAHVRFRSLRILEREFLARTTRDGGPWERQGDKRADKRKGERKRARGGSTTAGRTAVRDVELRAEAV